MMDLMVRRSKSHDRFFFNPLRASELARQDLNLDNLDQNQVCYRYTTGQARNVEV